MREYDNNLVRAQSFMLMINFLYKLVFHMIAFTVLLDEDRPFAKQGLTGTQTDVIAMKKRSCYLNSNQFILCGL
jgi:hypothetical protein